MDYTFYIMKKIFLKKSCEKFQKSYESKLRVYSEKVYFLHCDMTSPYSRHFSKFLLKKTADLK